MTDTFPQISRSYMCVIIMENQGYYKVCAWWVPETLTNYYKTWQIGSALMFLLCYHDVVQEFLKKIVIADETFVKFRNP